MKDVSIAACMIAALTASAFAQDRIPWITDLDQARQTAQQQKRLVLLHFWSETCKPCYDLETYVFNRPEVIRAIRTGYIPVKINTSQHVDWVNHYKVDVVPTDVIVDPNGRELFRRGSPPDPNQYIAMLDGVKAHASVGSQPPAEVISSRPQNTSPDGATQTFSPRDSGYRLRGDSQQRVAQWEQPANNASRTDAWSEAPGQSTAPRSRPASVENPLANPMAGNVPAQPSPVAPRYANPYTNQQAAGGDRRWQDNQALQDNRWDSSRVARNPGWENRGGATAMAQPAPSPAEPATNPQVPAGHPPLGLDGYCPVSVVLQYKWVQGDPQWGAIHRGRTYLFAGHADQQRFLKDPDRFAPVLQGCDVVRFAESGQFVPGQRAHGLFCHDRIYLFADEAALEQFQSRPEYYVERTRQAVLPNQQATTSR